MKRPLRLHSLTLLSFQPPDVKLQIACGAGTYVRGIAMDLGEALECGAHALELRRVLSGPFDIQEALPLDEVLAMECEAFIKTLRDASQPLT